MVKAFLVVLSVLLVPTFALAAQTRMTCKNAVRSYEAVFDHEAKTFTVSSGGKTVRYRVRRVMKHPKGTVVSGKTVARGPSYIAYLGKDRRIDFMADGKVFQIDKCQ